MKKGTVSLLLVFCAFVIVFSGKAFAAFGRCGDDLIWNLDNNGVMTISGTGNMYNYSESEPLIPDFATANKIIIEDGVTSIGSYAFSDCKDIVCVTIPDSLSTIGNHAFNNCTGLSSIYIPVSVENISLPFFGCSASLKVYCEAEQAPSGWEEYWNVYKSTHNSTYGYSSYFRLPTYYGYTRDEYNFFISLTGEETEVVVPTGVRTICSQAFQDNVNLTKITIPATVTKIGESAFSGCSSLTSIKIPESVTSINEMAFFGCRNLTDVYYGGTNVKWYSISIGEMNEELFSSTIHFTDVINDFSDSGTWGNLNWTVQILDDRLALTISGSGDMNGYPSDSWRKYRANITSVIIEKGVTSIGTRSFSGCSSLTSITIPEGVTSIGSCAFSKCINLTDVFYGGTNIQWSSINIFTYEGGNVELINATIHFTEVINGYVDSGTWGDLNWTLHIQDENGILSISGNGAMNDFSQNSRDAWRKYKSCISSVTIENGVTSIAAYSFEGCERLVSISIPNSVTNIYSMAFTHCSNLPSINIPDGVTAIYPYTFMSCYKLSSVNIPEGVTSIWTQAFSYCSMPSINIPESVKTIGYAAFVCCDNLTDVYYGGTQAQWQQISIDSYNYPLTSATIHYISAPDFILPVDLTAIEEEAFTAGAFTHVKLSENTTKIGPRAFADCPNLRYIYIPEATTSIDRYAFDNVENLTIEGKDGSYAEFFAQKYGFKFEAVS